MSILRNLLDGFDDHEVKHFKEYHPYWLVFREKKNPQRDDFTVKMMEFKNGDQTTIKYFVTELNPLFAKGISVTYVPSHDPTKTNSSIRSVAEILAKKGRTDATSCLVRHKLIDKLSTGGNRAKKVHLDSIRVENDELIVGKTVLLLDDITTTHNSLLACKDLLLESGAKEVICYALGKTVR